MFLIFRTRENCHKPKYVIRNEWMTKGLMTSFITAFTTANQLENVSANQGHVLRLSVMLII